MGETLTSLGVSANGEILDDWDKIVKICQSGKASQFYSVGNYKNIDLGSEGTIPFAIGGFDIEIRADGKGFAPVTWIIKGLLSRRDWGSVTSLDLTWSSSSLRSTVNSQIYNNIPNVIKTNIVEVLKYTDDYISKPDGFSGNWSNGRYDSCYVGRTKEKVWPLVAGEVFQSNEKGGYAEYFVKTHKQYAYTMLARGATKQNYDGDICSEKIDVYAATSLGVYCGAASRYTSKNYPPLIAFCL